MRQARGTIAGLEQHRRGAAVFGGLAVRVAFDQLARFLERPSLGRLRRGAQRRMKMQVGHRAPIAGSGGERQIRPDPPIIVTQIFTLFAYYRRMTRSPPPVDRKSVV